VCHGQTPIQPDSVTNEDAYGEPKMRGSFKLLDSCNQMTTEKIVERIIQHRYNSKLS